MLAELGASHTHYYTSDDPAYYQLAKSSRRATRRGLERVSPGEITYPGIGVFTQADDQGRTFVTGVVEGAPAHGAGLWSVMKSSLRETASFVRLNSFRGKVGAAVPCRSAARPPATR